MAFQGSEGVEEQIEEPEDTLRVSPAEEMPVDGPPAVEESDQEPLLLPWDRFSSWLHCICVVGFDLELGQAVECVWDESLTSSLQQHHMHIQKQTHSAGCGFPRAVFLMEARESDASVCGSGCAYGYLWCALASFLACCCLGDTQFCFRFRQAAGRKLSLGCFLDHFDRDAPVCLKRDQGYYYGYVYFRQVRDKSLKRGYFQKSLVLISKLPYVTFFHSLLKLIAPEYFEKQEPCLEAACNDIDRWPTPCPGKILTLPIMGVVMKLRIPTCYDKPGTSQLVQSAPSDSLVSIVLPTVHEVDLFRCFHPVFFHIQMLWELVLLGEALVVMAPSPAESSDTVLALVRDSRGTTRQRKRTRCLTCISPLRYCSDFRPYFTIHDSEFKEYTTRTQAPPSVILGVTNPFFAKTLQHWPHIIRIGDMKQAGEMAKQMKVKKLKNLKTLDSKPGVYTAYKPFLNKDEDIIKQLQKGVQQKRPSAAQNAILRRYFLELTQSFIIPLSPPQLRPFNQEEFMKTLEKAGPQLTSRLKGDWIGLYRQFLRSPNFDGWFRNRRKEMTQKLEALHLEALIRLRKISFLSNQELSPNSRPILRASSCLFQRTCRASYTNRRAPDPQPALTGPTRPYGVN
ncbi:Protein DENND6A [Labeo rohita]|uniref:Protein DENND6A n=1 Tax=Labeo rohita TaxID=84645 RepID=A0ABQ8M7Y1_LABRO|nr:Protein DENND6A [Labeo rohita]